MSDDAKPPASLADQVSAAMDAADDGLAFLAEPFRDLIRETVRAALEPLIDRVIKLERRAGIGHE